MKVLIDTREKRPYAEFFDKLGISYSFKSLSYGDYSIKNFENEFKLERKTLNDFIISITKHRSRFERNIMELKSKGLLYYAIIIEASFYDIQNKNYQSKIEPGPIMSTIFMWSVKYNVPFFLVESRTGGALAVIKLSEAFLKYRGKNV